MNNFKLILLFLLWSTFAHCQKTTLIQNINIRAGELKHQLNKSEDSLILQGERSIYAVKIFNQDFNETYKIKNNNAEIPLTQLGVGRYVVEVILRDKLIILTLLRKEPFEISVKNSVVKDVPIKKEIVKKPITKKPSRKKPITKKITETPKTSTNKNNIKRRRRVALSDTKEKENYTSNYHYYIVNEINNGQSSRKIMKMSNLKEVKRLIKKNQLDIKSLKGKANTVIIWEVYDNTKFFKEKRGNPDYIHSESEHFNSIPYYTTANFKVDDKN